MLFEKFGGGLVGLRPDQREGSQLIGRILNAVFRDFLGFSERASQLQN